MRVAVSLKYSKLCLILGLLTGCQLSYANTSEDKYQPHLDLGGYYFTDTPHDAAFSGLFLPLGQNRHNLFYLDVRGIFKSNGGHAQEGNFGLAYRNLNDSKQRMLGSYIFFDRKKTTTTQYFSQVTLGVESWFNYIFAGANFYQPVGKHSVTDTSISSTGALRTTGSGTFNIFVTETATSISEVALVGGDLSIGYQIIDPLIAYVGTYYFKSSVSDIKVPTVLGGMLHGRYSFFNNNGKLIGGLFEQVTVEGQLQYDSSRGTRFYGGVRFSLGVGGMKLDRMQRHMVEQSLRDIDLVISGNKSVSTITGFAKTESGTPIVVNQVSTTTAFNNAVGDPNVNIIAVQGVITDANASSTTLATDQRISGGNDIIIFNGRPVTVTVSTGGELQSATGTNLIKIGKNNTIRDITLTMVSPPNTVAGNKAIYVDTTVNDLGVLAITNVTSNGRVEITRTGASQKGAVIVTGSSFTLPSTYAPPSVPSHGNFFADNSSSLTVTINKSTFKVNSTTEVLGVRCATDNSGTMTIAEITDNNLDGSDAGLVISASRGGKTTCLGNISGNTINGGNIPAGVLNEDGLQIFVFGTPASEVTIRGAIKNNNISGANSAGLRLANFGSAATAKINIEQGIINNTISSNNSNAIVMNVATNASFTINNCYGNTLSPGGANTGFSLTGPALTVNVGQGSTGLSAANKNATITTANSPTVNPGL